MREPPVRCDVCGHRYKRGEEVHIDGDGFTGCRPCFPVSNKPEDGNRFLRGACPGRRT